MDSEPTIVGLYSHGFYMTDGSDRAKNFSYVTERHFQLTHGDGREFVQYLNADGSLLDQQLDSTIGIHPAAAEEFVTMREPTR